MRPRTETYIHFAFFLFVSSTCLSDKHESMLVRSYSLVSLRALRIKPLTVTRAVHNQSPKGFIVSLERSVGARQGVDREIAEAGQFSAEVYPDLPVASTWGELFGRGLKWYTSSIHMLACLTFLLLLSASIVEYEYCTVHFLSRTDDQTFKTANEEAPGRMLVKTVGCQVILYSAESSEYGRSRFSCWISVLQTQFLT